jgi:hypothetical protein
MSDPDDLLALQQAVLSVQDMREAVGNSAAGPGERSARTRRRSPTGSVANGGSLAIPNPGSPRR